MMLLPLGGLVFLLSAIDAAGVERGPRWYSREVKTVTKVIRLKEVTTEATPSSCVVVQTSLPPCRHIRAVDQIQPTQTVKIMATDAPVSTKGGWKPILQPSDPIPPKTVTKATPTTTPSSGGGWGWDFFNFGGPKHVTVTKTVKDIQTKKYMDPNTVVTFSVKGCRPSRLPFDLPECQPPPPITEPPTVSVPEPDVPERGVIVMAPIQFVAPMPEEQISPHGVADNDGRKEENPGTKSSDPDTTTSTKV